MSNIAIRIMRYTTLLLLVLVLLYGFQMNPDFHNTISVASFSDQLPIYCVKTSKPFLALTFDSAWGDEDLEDILQILKKHNAFATFFVTGEWAEKYPNAIETIHKNGHELANHGYSHKHMPQISVAQMEEEIKHCHASVKKITGTDMTAFRAPYSDWNPQVITVAHSLGYASINHSVDSLDWKDYGVDSIVNTVCQHKNLENGSIILLHNGTKYTKDALDVMLTHLEEQGYSFVKISDLIYKKNYHFDHTGKQIPNNP